VFGFGDLGFAADTHPALTTVRIDGTAIGRRAARFIVDRVEGVDNGERIVDLGFSHVGGRQGLPTPRLPVRLAHQGRPALMAAARTDMSPEMRRRVEILLQATRGPVDLSSVVAGVVEAVRPLAEERRIFRCPYHRKRCHGPGDS